MYYQWKELEKTIPTIPNTKNRTKIDLQDSRNKVDDNVNILNKSK